MTKRRTQVNPSAFDIIGVLVVAGVAIWIGSKIGQGLKEADPLTRIQSLFPTFSPSPTPIPSTGRRAVYITLSHVDYTKWLVSGSDITIRWTITYNGPVALYTVGVSLYTPSIWPFAQTPAPFQIIEVPAPLEDSPSPQIYYAEATQRLLASHGRVGIIAYIKDASGKVVSSNHGLGDIVVF